MMNYRNEFILWYFNEFQSTNLYRNMVGMTENSPWHRERNVGVHTDMVVAQYLALADDGTWMNEAPVQYGRQFLLGAFAATFHDVGKPWMVEHKFSETRGNYKAFNGHEKRSARMWEDWAVTNWPMLTHRFQLNQFDLYKIGWMVENHLPWGLKDRRKVENLGLTVLHSEIEQAFMTLLMADTTGRISDDADTKYMRSLDWITDFSNLLDGLYMLKDMEHDQPQLVMPIGPSGAGKTTLFAKHYQDQHFGHFSLDEMRMFWAADQTVLPTDVDDKELYSFCWGYCKDNEAEFRAHWQADYTSAIKRGKNLFVDGTNLSKKARRYFLTLAERHGYWTTAWLMPTTLQEVKDRQTRRSDKSVPDQAVEQQYNALQLPWYGEFNEVFILGPVE